MSRILTSDPFWALAIMYVGSFAITGWLL